MSDKDTSMQLEITRDWIDRLVRQETPSITFDLSDLTAIQAALHAITPTTKDSAG